METRGTVTSCHETKGPPAAWGRLGIIVRSKRLEGSIGLLRSNPDVVVADAVSINRRDTGAGRRNKAGDT